MKSVLKLILAILIALIILAGVAYLFLQKAEKYVETSIKKEVATEGLKQIKDVIGERLTD